MTILHKNTYKNSLELINNRFVYQETPPEAQEAPKPSLTPKEMEHLQKLALKKMKNEYASDTGKKSPPLTKKEQKKYDAYLARLTADERNKFDTQMLAKTEEYLKKNAKEMTGYGDVRTAEQQARDEAREAKKKLADAAKAAKEAEAKKKPAKDDKFLAGLKKQMKKKKGGGLKLDDLFK